MAAQDRAANVAERRVLRVETAYGTVSKTANRPYTYVVVARGNRHADLPGDELYGRNTWSTRLDLATRVFKDRCAHYRNVHVYEVATGREVLAAREGAKH